MLARSACHTRREAMALDARPVYAVLQTFYSLQLQLEKEKVQQLTKTKLYEQAGTRLGSAIYRLRR